MSNVHNVSQRAAAEMHLLSANRTPLEYSTVSNTAIDYVSDAIGSSFVTVKHNNFKKATHFMFDELDEAQNFIKAPIIYQNRQVGLYQTINIDKKFTIIKIKNFVGVGIKDIIPTLVINPSPIVTMTDIGARANENAATTQPPVAYSGLSVLLN
ncbi:hypothetical protein BB561_000982 [Smittium simulii]|uniref:Uncharacterized protein n=1 Tax=Smittium simulii TaxID=133385 RepID=A0A2T9YWR9_9FUNG|nr:hypothetical protein BB561_000982 [Smittium simulii]